MAIIDLIASKMQIVASYTTPNDNTFIVYDIGEKDFFAACSETGRELEETASISSKKFSSIAEKSGTDYYVVAEQYRKTPMIKLAKVADWLGEYIEHSANSAARDLPQKSKNEFKLQLANAEHFLKWFKETVLPDIELKKRYAMGRRGELVIKRRFKAQGCKVVRADKELLEKGLIDFEVTDIIGQKRLVEIKIRNFTYLDEFGSEFYYFPQRRLDAYIALASFKNLPFELFILNALKQKVYRRVGLDLKNFDIRDIPGCDENPCYLISVDEDFWFVADLTDQECDYILNCNDDPLDEVTQEKIAVPEAPTASIDTFNSAKKIVDWYEVILNLAGLTELLKRTGVRNAMETEGFLKQNPDTCSADLFKILVHLVNQHEDPFISSAVDILKERGYHFA